MAVIRRFDSITSTDIAIAGGKGANLGELVTAGLPVPPGFVITTEAYDVFVQQSGLAEQIVGIAGAVAPDDHRAAEEASEEIGRLFGSTELPSDLVEQLGDAYRTLADVAGIAEVAVAVRSSATAEDLEDASFAGQQDSYLNVAGAARLAEAVRNCWASLWTPRAIGYRRRHNIGPDEVSLAVVVQLLIDADAAGVLFTANPTTGRQDETVISAAWGLGESVVGGSVSTDNLTLRREGESWELRSCEIADKAVQTVRTATGTDEVAVVGARRKAPVLSDAEAIRLADIGLAVAEHYHRSMDLEWARRDGTLWLVQARPITALPDPIGDPPTDWSVPDPSRMYFRASIVEMMPEPLTPLFGDLIGPAVVQSLGGLFEELLGTSPAQMLIFPTINGYAYYGFGRRALAVLSLRAAPVMVRIFSGGGSEARWRDHYRPQYLQAVRRWSERDLAQLSAQELITGVRSLLLAGCTYYTGVQQVIPVAASTETIFSRMYRMIRRPSDPDPTTFVLGLESSPMRAERALYRLGRWCADHPELLDALTGDGSVGAFGPAPESVPAEAWDDWQSRLAGYLDEFGHTISDLDFAHPVAADDPSAVVETVRFYARDDAAADPAIRQRRLAAERERATAELLARLDPVRRRLVQPVLRKAQSYGAIREDALADVGLAWPTLRQLLAELGARLSAAGAIESAEQVFWLRADEVDAAAERLDRGEEVANHAPEVAERQMVRRGRRRVTPPQLLPASTMNAWMERWMPAVEGDAQEGAALRGLGASGGRVTGPACLITEQADFAKMQPGMIIVAKITTPAYTPLFAMAKAVVTDVGGPLSHSSIVAREYGIPAVLGTGVATQRIQHGAEITVDGSAGRVLLDGGDVDDGEPDEQQSRSWAGWIAAGAAVGLLWWRRARRRSRS